jgi:streptogramin lyase
MKKSVQKRVVIGVLGAAALVGSVLGAGAAQAADPLGTVNAYSPEGGATLAGELISWQGEVLANRNLNGFTAFNVSGAAQASPIPAGAPIKTMAIWNNFLIWIDNANNVKNSNAGGTVTGMGAVAATSDSLLAVGPQLWITRSGGIDRYAPSGSALGGASSITLSAASTSRMAIGPDGNVWVVEKTGGVDTLTRWSTAGAPVGSTYNFTNSSADPTDIVAGPDNAMWVIQSGTNSIGRFDSNLGYSEYVLPGGAAPRSLVSSSDGGVWVSENGLNNVSRLSFAAGQFTRAAYAAPSAFGLRSVIVGPDANVWSVGTNANKVARFGTVLPTTTTTTTVAATTVATTTPTTVATTVATVPTTVATVPTTLAKKRVCIKSKKTYVTVKGKRVLKVTCTKYALR